MINSSNISGREKTKPRALFRVHTSNSDGYELSKDMPRIRRAKKSDTRKAISRGGKYKRIPNIQALQKGQEDGRLKSQTKKGGGEEKNKE